MRLIHGDCLEEMDKLIDDGVKVDVIITDPPYGTTACKWDAVIPFDEMWPRLKALKKERAPVVLFGSEPFSSALRMSNIKEFKYDWIWDKITAKGHLVAKKRPMQQTENISVFNVGITNYYPQMVERPEKYKTKTHEYKRTEIMGGKSKKQIKEYTHWYPKNLLRYKTERGFHPTQKPVDLLEYLIKTYTKEGDTVLDFTMGSGTTGVACKNLGRDFIGIELDENYFNIAKERIEQTPERLF